MGVLSKVLSLCCGGDGGAGKKRGGTSLAVKVVALVCLVFQTTAAVILTRYLHIRGAKPPAVAAAPGEQRPSGSGGGGGGASFHPAVLVMLQEFLKMLLSVLLIGVVDFNSRSGIATAAGDTREAAGAAAEGLETQQGEEGRRGGGGGGGARPLAALRSLTQRLRYTIGSLVCFSVAQPREMLRSALPAALYTLQNITIYVAISHLDSTLFQIAYQSKVVVTGVLWVWLLRRSLSWRKWGALFLLSFGIVLSQLGDGAKKPKDGGAAAGHGGLMSPHTVKGLVCVSVAVLCSGMAGVYFEFVMKTSALDAVVGAGTPAATEKHLESPAAGRRRAALRQVLDAAAACAASLRRFGLRAPTTASATAASSSERLLFDTLHVRARPPSSSLSIGSVCDSLAADTAVRLVPGAANPAAQLLLARTAPGADDDDDDSVEKGEAVAAPATDAAQLLLLVVAPASVWVRNAHLALFSFIISVGYCLWLFVLQPSLAASGGGGGDGEKSGKSPLRPRDALSGLDDPLTWAIILIQAFGGLLIAMVMRYTDNVVKCFATAFSIILCGFCSAFLFGMRFSSMFFVGAAMVVVATTLYSF